MPKYTLSADELSVQENGVSIATFKSSLDAYHFKCLKEDKYVEVTDTWLSSELFFQRLKKFALAEPVRAKQVASRFSKIV